MRASNRSSLWGALPRSRYGWGRSKHHAEGTLQCRGLEGRKSLEHKKYQDKVGVAGAQ